MIRRSRWSIVMVLAAISFACTKTAGPAPVVLPDLTGLAESVQRQIRERDTELKQTLARSGASRAEQASAYGALGRVLMAAKFSDQAAACFSHAEALAADDMRWPYYGGHAYLRKGDRARAAAAFERALKVRPDDLTSLVWLGESYLDDDRLDPAASAFQRAIAAQPQSAPALFGAGRTALARQQYSEAAQYLERALVVDARASAIHYPLAMAYRGLGNTQKADEHLRQRGSNYPALPDPLMKDDEDVLESAVAFENRGLQALKQADFSGAVAAFRKGLDLDPHDASLRYWLGAALSASGEIDGAIREFSAVVQQSPDNARAHFSLGAIYDIRNQREKAIEEYREAVRADPNMAEAHVRLGGDLQASHQTEASFEQYEAAVKLDPSVVEAWIGGAQALMALKHNDKAAAWLTGARRLYPNRAEFAELQTQLRDRH